MITLTQAKAPYDLELLDGLTVTVRPVGALDIEIARSAADQRIREIEAGIREARLVNMIPAEFADGEALIDFDDPAQREGLKSLLVIEEIAARHIEAWNGVGLEGDAGDLVDADPTPENKRAFVRVWPISEMFFAEITRKQTEIALAKKG